MMLFDALKELSCHCKNQVIITTHTPEFAKLSSEENLIFIKKQWPQEQPILFTDANTKMSEIADTLGILPYLKKVAVCVEGDHDCEFLMNINNNIPELKELIDFESVTLIPMIGSNLKGWVDKNHLSKFNIKEYHLYDRDKDSKYQQDIDRVNARNDGSQGRLTKFLTMENYCPPSLIECHFKIKLDADVKKSWSESDIVSLIKQKTTFNEKNIKRQIAGLISKSITKNHLVNELCCWDEVREWFLDIKRLVDTN